MWPQGLEGTVSNKIKGADTGKCKVSHHTAVFLGHLCFVPVREDAMNDNCIALTILIYILKTQIIGDI